MVTTCELSKSFVTLSHETVKSCEASDAELTSKQKQKTKTGLTTEFVSKNAAPFDCAKLCK